MARIKVTGYLDTDDLPPEMVDLDHEMGLSERGYEALTGISGTSEIAVSDLSDPEFEKVEG